jgi:hypothetical protein
MVLLVLLEALEALVEQVEQVELVNTCPKEQMVIFMDSLHLVAQTTTMLPPM